MPINYASKLIFEPISFQSNLKSVLPNIATARKIERHPPTQIQYFWYGLLAA